MSTSWHDKLLGGFRRTSDRLVGNLAGLGGARLDDADIVHAHIFPYSPRAGTPAARMPQVAPAVARDRAAALRAAAAARLGKRLADQVGTVQPVLVEKPGDRGHAPDFAEVRLPSSFPIGSIVAVTVTAAAADHLTGTIV